MAEMRQIGEDCQKNAEDLFSRNLYKNL